jgi:glycosyltransferase involved in cell wall biosynthesis
MNPLLVNLTLPVFNEAGRLAESVNRLRVFLKEHAQFRWELVIANNGSTDRTLEVAEQLSRQWPDVRLAHLPEKGRGRALKRVWSESPADILSYMDIDLSMDLQAIPRLIEPLASGDYDLATGSRLLPASQTTRCWKREIISRGYNRLLKAVFHTRFTDAGCGFKAITQQAARELLPRLEHPGFFFDAELLVWAERWGCRVLDLPVRWVEDPDSRVRGLQATWQNLGGMLRLRRDLALEAAARFVAEKALPSGWFWR